MNKLTIQDGFSAIEPEIKALPTEIKDEFLVKLREELMLFQKRMLQAFPDAHFEVVARVAAGPTEVSAGRYRFDAVSSKPKFYINVNIGGFVRGRITIFDEMNRQNSVYHRIAREMKVKL